MVILVHGGAGRVPEALREAVLEGVQRARDEGWRVLRQGGSAMDAVVAAVKVMEDDPVFNAGTGAALNRAGAAELDAAVMDGETLAFGGVAAVRDVKNPIELAREVMNSEHILLCGEGASAFARERGIPHHPPSLLVTEHALARWREVRKKGLKTSGTVGAVALDGQGRLAAATSTGGIVDKRVGRIGDTPLVGAGTYAEKGLGAASATGEGEFLARALVTYRSVSALRHQEPKDALFEALALAKALGGEGGIILVTADGRPVWHRTSPQMSFAFRSDDDEGAGLE